MNEIKQRPILFSTPMVQAIMEGRKTQTRRVVKPQPHQHHWGILPGYKQGAHLLDTTKGPVASFYDYRGPGTHEQNGTSERNAQVRCPYGEPGDILYVRETWQYVNEGEDSGYVYKASQNGRDWEENSEGWKWKPSLFMPKEAARIFLRITDIRVERLQDITEDDAMAEGTEPMHHRCGGFGYYEAGGEIIECSCLSWNQGEYCMGFKLLWQSINGPESWTANPWTWCVSFERIDKPEKSPS